LPPGTVRHDRRAHPFLPRPYHPATTAPMSSSYDRTQQMSKGGDDDDDEGDERVMMSV